MRYAVIGDVEVKLPGAHERTAVRLVGLITADGGVSEGALAVAWATPPAAQCAAICEAESMEL